MSATALPPTGLPERPQGAPTPHAREAAPPWEPCSDRSAERGDPVAGTAGLGERWLLAEIDGSWGRDAFFESRLDPVIGRALVRRAESAGVRPVAIRRPARRADARRATTGWRWALVDARPGHERVGWGFAPTTDDLLTVPLDADSDTGEASLSPVYLVCTHARHDQCCAVKGRPVVTALAAAYPDETWECSHLGGDRFAATMLLLPHGLSYGRVMPDEVAGIVDAAARGRIVPQSFRGRTAFSMPVQAAQAFARAELGDDRIDAWAPLGEKHESDLVHVRLAGSEGDVVVTLRETLSEPLLSTCTATIAAPVRQFALAGIHH